MSLKKQILCSRYLILFNYANIHLLFASLIFSLVNAKNIKKGGELWVVANRHLAYHIKLKKIFNNYEQIASNKKFVILKVVKR